ncbi:MAG TPA: MarP family serine protease [Gaiellaceae bacterium]
MSTLDWVAIAVIVLAALYGFRRGLIASGLSLVGVVVGAIIGGRLAPHLLAGGSRSPYTPLAALAGATVGAALLQSVALMAGSIVRGSLRFTPLRALDSAGGLLLGAAAGLALVWVLGAVALLLPGEGGLRNAAQSSAILRRLNDAVPPRSLLNTLARIDPFPSIAAPGAAPEAPDPSVAQDPTIARAASSVVRILGTACGIGIEGSGWVARPGLVVTAAHVVAGEQDTDVQALGAPGTLPAQAVVFDRRNDVAVLRVDGLTLPPLPFAPTTRGAPVALLGYPGDGPLRATPGRIGRTAAVFSLDAYGRGPVTRTITTLSGRVRHGNSGGPAVDREGRVQAMVFASRVGTASGYGVPSDVLADAVDKANGPVSTQGCAD